MTDTTHDDLVKRLRGWVRDIREGSTALWAMDQDLKAAADRIEELERKLAKTEEASIDVGASLAAAISLLERGGKKAAPSDKMFNQMLADYNASLDRLRTTLAELKGQGDD